MSAFHALLITVSVQAPQLDPAEMTGFEYTKLVLIRNLCCPQCNRVRFNPKTRRIVCQCASSDDNAVLA